MACRRCGCACVPNRRASGAGMVEFVLVLIASLALLAPAGELLRLSLIDQTLARATHLAARGAGSDPDNCVTAIRDAYEADAAARWLLDINGDGRSGHRQRGQRLARQLLRLGSAGRGQLGRRPVRRCVLDCSRLR